MCSRPSSNTIVSYRSSTGTNWSSLTVRVLVRFFKYADIVSSVRSVCEAWARTFAKSLTCAFVIPTQPCDAKVPIFASGLPPCINDGQPIGILIGPSGFCLLPAAITSPGVTFIESTQGESGGVQVGLKMIICALRKPCGKGNCG